MPDLRRHAPLVTTAGMNDSKDISMLLCALLAAAYVAWRLRRLETVVSELREAMKPSPPPLHMPALTPAQIDRLSDARDSPPPEDTIPEAPVAMRATVLPAHRRRG